jgi:hypothetical protein
VAAGAGIRCLRAPQSMRVRGLRLRFELRRVALAAGRPSDVARSGVLPANGMTQAAIAETAKYRNEIISRASAMEYHRGSALCANPALHRVRLQEIAYERNGGLTDSPVCLAS